MAFAQGTKPALSDLEQRLAAAETAAGGIAALTARVDALEGTVADHESRIDALEAEGLRPATHVAAGIPAASFGIDGDTYIDRNTLIMYERQGGTWSFLGQLWT